MWGYQRFRVWNYEIALWRESFCEYIYIYIYVFQIKASAFSVPSYAVLILVHRVSLICHIHDAFPRIIPMEWNRIILNFSNPRRISDYSRMSKFKFRTFVSLAYIYRGRQYTYVDKNNIEQICLLLISQRSKFFRFYTRNKTWTWSAVWTAFKPSILLLLYH